MLVPAFSNINIAESTWCPLRCMCMACMSFHQHVVCVFLVLCMMDSPEDIRESCGGGESQPVAAPESQHSHQPPSSSSDVDSSDPPDFARDLWVQSFSPHLLHPSPFLSFSS